MQVLDAALAGAVSRWWGVLDGEERLDLGAAVDDRLDVGEDLVE
jgi:hypothetical protein